MGLIQFKGAGVELIIGALFSQQLFVVAPLDDLPLLQHHDDSRQLRTVESRWAMTKTVRPYIRLSMPCCTMASVRVSMEEVASSRIMHRRIGHRRPGNGQQLPLALGEVGAVAGEHGVVPIGQAGG